MFEMLQALRLLTCRWRFSKSSSTYMAISWVACCEHRQRLRCLPECSSCLQEGHSFLPDTLKHEGELQGLSLLVCQLSLTLRFVSMLCLTYSLITIAGFHSSFCCGHTRNQPAIHTWRRRCGYVQRHRHLELRLES